MQLDNFQCWMILVRYSMIWVIFGMYDYGYRGFRGFPSHGGTPIAGWFMFHGPFWALGAGASHSWDDHERNRLPKRPSNGLVTFSSSVGMGIWKKTHEIWGPKLSKLSNMSRVGPWDLLRPKYSSLTRPGFRWNAACAAGLHREMQPEGIHIASYELLLVLDALSSIFSRKKLTIALWFQWKTEKPPFFASQLSFLGKSS